MKSEIDENSTRKITEGYEYVKKFLVKNVETKSSQLEANITNLQLEVNKATEKIMGNILKLLIRSVL